MTTNYLRAWFGITCMAHMPPMLTTYPDANELPILTNTAVIAILQDSLRDFGRIISSNATSAVVSCRLSDGDVAVALWNLNTNAQTTISIPLSSVPGCMTTSPFALELFSGVAAKVTNTLSATVNIGGLNLYLVSKDPLPKGSVTGVTTTLLDLNTNTLTYVNGVLTKVTAFANMPITNGLVGWWKLDDGVGAGGDFVKDSTAYGNSGQLTYAGTPTWTNTASGRTCLYFATNGSVNLPNVPILNVVGPVSLFAWVNLINPGANTRYIIGGRVLSSDMAAPLRSA